MTSALDPALEFAGIVEGHGIAYAHGGSLASSAVGEPRTTMDVDMCVASVPSFGGEYRR